MAALGGFPALPSAVTLRLYSLRSLSSRDGVLEPKLMMATVPLLAANTRQNPTAFTPSPRLHKSKPSLLLFNTKCTRI